MGDMSKDNQVCPHCIASIGLRVHICPHCGGVVTSHASTDPIVQIYSTGKAYRNAIESPTRMVVIGIWLIFGPQVLMLLAGMYQAMANLIMPSRSGVLTESSFLPLSSNSIPANLIQIAVMLVILVIYVVILQKLTSRYFALSQNTKQ